MSFNLKKAHSISGIITAPGDKSISHRSIMLGALANGETVVTNFLPSADCYSTMDCFRKMGVEIEEIDKSTIRVHGCGLHGLKSPNDLLFTGNSGTTTRLITGILAGQDFDSVVDGDESIRRRPMKRILTPLSLMGADIISCEGGLAPLNIHGKELNGITYELPVASAQLKSCILLAGLYANGETIVSEKIPTRDHTERMLRAFGANICDTPDGVCVKKTDKLIARKIDVPGDISSAAFFMVAGSILPDSDITIKNVGVNPTRTGIIDVLKKMGADIEPINLRDDWEPVADIRVRSSNLSGCEIGGADIPRLIDELPIIAVAACFAQGKTVIRDAEELRHKESNRISAMVCELKKAGADITETDDGMIINGGKPLHGAEFNAYNDHRIAMAMAVLALSCKGNATIDDTDCVGISYPEFFDDLYSHTECE